MAFTIEFVSPESILYSGEGTMVTARTRGGGDIAFLAGHEPFIGTLETGEVKVTEADGSMQRWAVRSGFVSVTGDKVTVLSDLALPMSEIDVTKAQGDLASADAALAADQLDEFALADKKWAELRLTMAGADA
ncbi:MAG: ATP synthase F1 subunit epsilon [Acidimicrobiia bacterium]|nr:ATP synthase F1 subunit epsilon [Acidimicrobiia bacterium]